MSKERVTKLLVDLGNTDSVLAAARQLIEDGNFMTLRKLVSDVESARGIRQFTGNVVHNSAFSGEAFESATTAASTWDRHFADAASGEPLVRATLDAGLTRRDRERIADWRRRSPAAGRLVAFGSCFARELSVAFAERGLAAEHLQIEENINSPDANLEILKALGRKSEFEFVEQIIGHRRQEIAGLLGRAEILCVTVGVAPVFVEKGSGKLFLAQDYRRPILAGKIEQVLPGVDHLRAAIEGVVRELERLAPNAIKLLTLSPVPLSGAVGDIGVVSYDLLSKASLRVALHEAGRNVEFVYLPSFEAVKWIAPHVPAKPETQAFGLDDGVNRHVSRWLVKAITDWACDTLGVAPRG